MLADSPPTQPTPLGSSNALRPPTRTRRRLTNCRLPPTINSMCGSRPAGPCCREWVWSLDIESLQSQHPAVSQAAVVGVADERWGERALVVEALKPDASATPDELRAKYS